MTPPTDLCTSPLFSIRETPHSGRGIYARKRITKTTLLFETPGLSASVVYRQYRKEVCTYCFAYDRGRQWKLRDAQTGVAFCGEECRELWKGEFSLDDHAIRLEALSAVEALGKSSRQKTTAADDEVERQPSPPNEEIIAAAWHTAERTAELIRAARLSDRASKAERRALNQVLSVPSSMDNLSYILSCVLCAAFDSSSWTDILHLETDHTPYASSRALDCHITSYLHLLASCPLDLLPHIRSVTISTFVQKSAHNVFDIWSQDLAPPHPNAVAPLGSSGSECLGLGLWPAASYWNHSCAPNVLKRRAGRKWQFWAARDIDEDEELCITYLGGDERDLSREERRDKLEKGWGFQCACIRCAHGVD